VSIGVTIATATRVTSQLSRDHRTLALALLAPGALLALFSYVLDAQPQTFGRIGVPLIGIFPLILMFLISSIAMLRERTSGTLERLMSMPIAKLDLLLGYGLAFGLLATLQTLVTSAVAFGLLDVGNDGPVWAVVGLAVTNALLGMALGLFLSAFATSEFQAVQFMPVVIIPQLLLAGLIVPRDAMPTVLEHVSDFLPFTYAYEALAKVAADDLDARLWFDVVVVLVCVVICLILGATTLRRRTP
jgi:ABC-2 type transport system permease protein